METFTRLITEAEPLNLTHNSKPSSKEDRAETRSKEPFSQLISGITKNKSLVSYHLNKSYHQEYDFTLLQAPEVSRHHKNFAKAFQFHGRSLHISLCNLGDIVQFKLADIGEGIKEVTIKEWYVAEHQPVAQFDNICEVQSDKAAVTITSRFDGVIKKLHHAVDDIALVGQALVDIEVEDGAEAGGEAMEKVEKPAASTTSSQPLGSFSTSGRALATPAVRKMAAENKIDISTIRGTGRDGRVLKEDIINHLQSGTPEKPSSPSAPRTESIQPRSTVETPQIHAPQPLVPTPPVQRPMSPIPEDRPLLLTGIVKAMVKSMTQANDIPHFSYCDEVDVTSLVKLRQDLKRRDTNISFMPFMIKAASVALADFPILNSHADASCTNVMMKGAHNISVAMDTPSGLMVPNIKSVQNLSILDISQELRRLMELGQAGRLSTTDISGGTFTLSNIGNVGGTYTRPLILPPQVCIGGIGKIQRVPRFVSDESMEVRAANVMTVSWAADHRVIDGVTMANFGNKWKDFLEQPELMLLHLK